ncbi:MAG TPA: universal stress protein [Chromatiales bacterium]|nr:universal stress protein [Chromatiales bacterium]
METYKHILVATDFSEQSKKAVQRAVELANHYGARVTLLHAVEEMVLYDEFYEPMFDNIAELDEVRMNRAGEQLAELIKELDAEGAHSEVILGYPKRVILDYAEDHNVDLIVVGYHSDLLSRLMGSTASSVVHHAQCDVLTVHT